VTSRLAQQIDDLLPQTQCTKCGFAGCAPYAQALATDAAEPNQCPPGGQEGVVRLARLLGKPAMPLNPENGTERPRPRAVIDEAVCIGCTLCIQACPVDAIVGAAKSLHTVIAEDCTGCDLCVAPCPVDCITMVPVTGDTTGWQAWSQAQADTARSHYLRKLARQQREQIEADARAARRAADRPTSPPVYAEDVATGAATVVTTVVTTVSAPVSAPLSPEKTTPGASRVSPPTGASDSGTLAKPEAKAETPTAADDAQAKKEAIIKAAIERARLRRAGIE